MNDVIPEYDLTPSFKDVKLSGQLYRVKEASEAVSMRYRVAMSKGVTIGPDGKPSNVPDGYADSESEFVAGCTFKVEENGTESKVLVGQVRQWPRKVVAALFDLASSLSKLEKGEAKNSLSAGTDTSV